MTAAYLKAPRSRGQQEALKRLQKKVAALQSQANAVDQAAFEEALAGVIAEGRLVAEKLGLDRQRMTRLVNARLGEELA